MNVLMKYKFYIVHPTSLILYYIFVTIKGFLTCFGITLKIIMLQISTPILK